MTDPLCPYCKIPLRWEQFKEVWFCRTHGVFEVIDKQKPCCSNCKYFGIDGALMACFYIKYDIQHVQGGDSWCNQWERQKGGY